jgi:two-component system, OmpR family, response regulator RegX3
MSTSLLLVEDEVGIARPLIDSLRREGFRVRAVMSGRDAIAELGSHPVDLVLLDLMLPDVDGRDICAEIRSMSQVPIIIVTARGTETDRIVGLELGADDYVAKPFSARELIARIKAVLRRARPHQRDLPIWIGDLALDVTTRMVTQGGRPVDLTPREFDLLHLLMERAGEIVSREDIMSEVWDPHWFGSTKTLDVHVSALRKKLGDDPNDPIYIRTVRGIGLRFSSPEEFKAASAAV